jgi:hypothetical protein
MTEWLEIVGVASAGLAAVFAFWAMRVRIPSITVNHRDGLPQSLREQSRRAGFGAFFAAVTTLCQALEIYLR